MKKRSILVILLLVFLAGCGKEAGTAGTGGARFTQKQIEEFHTLSREAAFVWLGDEDAIVLEETLPAGSVLLGGCVTFDDDPGMQGFSRHELAIGSYSEKSGVWSSPVWDTYEPSHPILNEYSFAFAWRSYAGTDLLFVVSPAGDLPGTYHVPYAESEWNGITPYDSMGTEPILLCDEEVLDGYPTWIFCTTVEDLPEDYELHYGDQVVTYRDLRSWLSTVDDYMPE